MIPTDLDTIDGQEGIVDVITSLVPDAQTSILVQPREATLAVTFTKGCTSLSTVPISGTAEQGEQDLQLPGEFMSKMKERGLPLMPRHALACARTRWMTIISLKSKVNIGSHTRACRSTRGVRLCLPAKLQRMG